jgi:thioredoxin-related protein
MRTVFITSWLMLAAVFSAVADEVLPVLKVGDMTYTNVTVTSVSATDVFFTHAKGMGNVKLKTLSPELQKHFQFDTKKAQAAELKQAENKAKYHEQLLKEPVARPPDMSREPSSANHSGSALWRDDFHGALKQARAEGKLVLLDFTGSDWCPSCIKLEQDVFSKPTFAAYAGKKLQLVKVDFPRRTALPEDQKRANGVLSETFKVEAFPTLILVNPDGRELVRVVGYVEGGPGAFIAILERATGR